MDPKRTPQDSDDSDSDGFTIDESTYLKLKEALRLANVPLTERSFENFEGKISLSADIVEKPGITEMHEFLAIFLHFIDETWTLKKLAIKCCSIDDVLGAEPLKAITGMLDKEWDDIKDQIGSMTLNHDFEAPEFDDIKKHVNEENLLLNGRLFRVNCAAETINMVVQSVFGEIRSTIFKIRRLCPGREPALWHRKNSNLKQALDKWSKGEFSSKNKDEIPSPEEWERVKVVCETVDKIHKVAKGLFHKEDVTSNLFLYNLDVIRAILTQFSIGSSETILGVEIKGMGLNLLNNYWKDMFLVLAISAVLDPRLKMKYAKFSCSKFWGSDEEAASQQVKTVSEAVRELYDQYEAKSEIKKGSEMDKYLEEPTLPWTDGFEALKWWKRASITEYPILSRIARDVLAIPMSLATGEEAFYSFQRRPVDARLEPICRQRGAF